MVARILLLLLFLVNGYTTSFAQNETWGINIDDTITASEKSEINRAIRNSTFGYYYLADSCSKKGDSTSASDYFLKINPYYLFFEGQTLDSISDFIGTHFTLTTSAKEKYIALFTKTYSTPKSKAYTEFKKMADEDQALRHKQENCRDSLCHAITRDELQYSDSAHFSYLYGYIKKNGWPTLSDGSMYATILAIHDHEHTELYLPIVKKAVLDGLVEPGALQLIVYWNTQNREYNSLDEYLATHTYIKYDITDAMYSNKLPQLLPEIEKTVKEHCPVKPIYFIESKNMVGGKTNKAFLEQTNKFHEMGWYENPMARLDAYIIPYDCGAKSDYRSAMETGIWTIHSKASDSEQIKLIVYLVFDRADADIKLKKVLAGERFTNHPIQFDYNSTSIKPENMDFMIWLAAWLKHFKTVKIEIDGHTDSEGSPEANMKLSRDRADEVKKRLIALGVDGNRLITNGYGATKPLNKNATPEGKANNRRVEFIKL